MCTTGLMIQEPGKVLVSRIQTLAVGPKINFSVHGHPRGIRLVAMCGIIEQCKASWPPEPQACSEQLSPTMLYGMQTPPRPAPSFTASMTLCTCNTL